MAELFTSENLIALLTLTSLEIVLGIDNIVFISILVAKLPAAQQARARRLGLLLAMGMRIALLLAITWVMGLTAPLFTRAGARLHRARSDPAGRRPLPGRQGDLGDPRQAGGRRARRAQASQAAGFGAILVQIMLLDIVFSLDSVITAVGMARDVEIMIAAVVIAVRRDDGVRRGASATSSSATRP